MSNPHLLRPVLVAGLLATIMVPMPVVHSAEELPPQVSIDRLTVFPDEVELPHGRHYQQLLITAQGSDGHAYDLTRQAQFLSASPAIAEVSAQGVVQPRGAGETQLTVQVEGQTVSVQVSVGQPGSTPPVSYAQEVLPILGKAGCNTGPCHGHASGKNGFKLSLRGYDPAFDYESLLRDQLGRRVDRVSPEASLILGKASGQVSHGGGIRFHADSTFYNLVREWIQEGAQNDLAEAARLERLEVFPAERLISQPGLSQQLVVRAHFAGGQVRDVTREAIYELTSDGTAEVTPEGLVTARREGETGVLVRYLGKMALSRFLVIRHKPDFVWSAPPPANFIDRHVDAKLKAVQVLPAELTTDAEFLRRVSLDTVGLPPRPEEVRAFLADSSADKRARKIDELLAREEFGEQWALYWLELSGSHESGASAGRRALWSLAFWLRDAINRNVPYDRLVREILTAQGSSIENPPVAFTANPLSKSEVFAQLFLGTRIECAQCHDHPFDVWTQADYHALGAFFSNVVKKDGPNYYAENQTLIPPERFLPWEQEKRVRLRHLDGTTVELSAADDHRQALAAWLFDEARGWSARALVNRVWGRLFGRGIVDPVDDLRFSNPPVNEPLLAALADDFVARNYDFKHLVRAILNSRTYQLSSTPGPANVDDRMYFSHAALRRLRAEQLLDAISQVTGVEDPLPGAPAGFRSAQLATMNTGSRFLATFGRSTRRATACTCERSDETSLPQILHLLNGDTIANKIASPEGNLAWLLKQDLDDPQLVTELYLLVLGRFPQERELQLAARHFAASPSRAEAAQDLMWALLNSQAFLFNH